MLCQTNESLFTRSGPAGNRKKTGNIGTDFPKHFCEYFAVLVVSDNAYAKGYGAQLSKVGCDRTRSAATVLGSVDSQHRYGRLRADSQSVSVEINIEHKVTHNHHLRRADICKRFQQVFIHNSIYTKELKKKYKVKIN